MFLLSQEDKSEDFESKEIPVEFNVSTKNEDSNDNRFDSMSKDELIKLINQQNSKLDDYEEKLKHSLADFANLQKKTISDIQIGIDNHTDKLFLTFLQIYDDFLRAKDAYTTSDVDTKGLDSILKNMDQFLTQHSVTSIEALGEIFNPNLHEAISIVPDSQLDDETITKEIRKGYISHNRVIRPTLVEISKRNK